MPGEAATSAPSGKNVADGVRELGRLESNGDVAKTAED
jgi:hypothetical protein